MKYNINNPRPLPSQRVLRRLFNYNEATGTLTYRARKVWMFSNYGGRGTIKSKCYMWNRRFEGKEAFTTVDEGRRVGKVCGHKHVAARVIYKWMTGEDPKYVKHMNGRLNDRRWVNLKNIDTVTL